jgi:hypothetical protein
MRQVFTGNSLWGFIVWPDSFPRYGVGGGFLLSDAFSGWGFPKIEGIEVINHVNIDVCYGIALWLR